MYVKPSNELFFQGDVLDDFPIFLHTPDGKNIDALETQQDSLYKVNKIPMPPASVAQEILGVFPGRYRRVIILTQTCDIQSNDYIQVAPVFSLEEVKSILNTKKIENLQTNRNRVKDWFYLPDSRDEKIFKNAKNDNFPYEGFVFLQTINSFPKDKLRLFIDKRIISLSEWGVSLLSWALADYFGRPIENKYRV